VRLENSSADIPPRSNLFDRALDTRDADYVGGVAGTCTGSASLRRLATASCSARAACLLRTFLDRLRPASGLRRCCSLFEVDLSAAELLDRVPPGSGGYNALLPKLVDWHSYNRQMSNRHFGASEHQSPCNVSASRTHVDLALDDRHLHGVVLNHIHQKHLIVSPAG